MPNTEKASINSEQFYALEQWKQRTKAAIEYAQEAIKAAILINGGGAVAILAFIGEVAKENSIMEPKNFTASLICFGVGVACAVIASACGYFAHDDYAKGFELLWRSPRFELLSRGPREERASERLGHGKLWHRLGTFFVLASILLFIMGIIQAAWQPYSEGPRRAQLILQC